MKTTKMLTVLVLASAIMVWTAEVSEAVEMGTAFTYQGHLYDNNDVANGQYDFQFKLYNDDEGEDQLCRDVNIADVNVIDGYFMVELDFNSPDVDWEEEGFTGQARWLKIGVRPGEFEDPNDYTPLTPLQKITPVPYALHAFSAGQMPWVNLTYVPAGFADGIDDDSGGDITAVNASTGLTGGGVSGDVALAVSFGGSGSAGTAAHSDHSHSGTYALISHIHDDRYYTETELNTGGGGGQVHWNNLSSVPAGFADGIDNVGAADLDWTISDSNMYSAVSGNVGIGTTSPQEKLHVGGDIRLDAGGDIAFADDNTRIHESSDDLYLEADDDIYISPDDNIYMDGNTLFVDGSLNRVGIGTVSPSANLHIVDSAGATGSVATGSDLLIDSGDSQRFITMRGPTSGLTGIVFSNSDGFLDGGLVYLPSSTAGEDRLQIRSGDNIGLNVKGNGNVGIGKTNPSYPLEMGSGAHCTAGGVWTDASSVVLKENFTEVNPAEVLGKVRQLSITRWNYKAEDATVQHIGPVAEDFHSLFGLGDSDKAISGVDRSGVAFAAIQGLYQLVEEKDAEIAALKEQNKEMQLRLAAVEAVVGKLDVRQEGGL